MNHHANSKIALIHQILFQRCSHESELGVSWISKEVKVYCCFDRSCKQFRRYFILCRQSRGRECRFLNVSRNSGGSRDNSASPRILYKVRVLLDGITPPAQMLLRAIAFTYYRRTVPVAYISRKRENALNASFPRRPTVPVSSSFLHKYHVIF